MILDVSYFRSAYDNRPIARSARLGDLVRTLMTRVVRLNVGDKRELPAWSPCRYKPGTLRSAANVEAVSALVLDYDTGKPWQASRDVWREWFHVMHSSWSHEDQHHKYRVIVPLLSPVPATLWPRVFAWAHARDPDIDAACKDPSRLFFLPAVRSDEWPWFSHEERTPRLLEIDPSTLPDPKPPPKFYEPKKPAPLDLDADGKRALMELRSRLKNERGLRERVANRLGAVIKGEPPRAEGIKCPQCDRSEAWFWIQPGPVANGAYCDHEKSCGWTGWLDELR